MLLRAAIGLLLALVALAVSCAVFLRLRALAEPAPLVVARRAIAVYEQLGSGDVELIYRPAAARGPDTYASPADVVGRYAARSLPAGAPLGMHDVVDAAELRYGAGEKAVIVGVQVPAGRAPVALLIPEQRVDVWRGARLVAGGLRLVAFTMGSDGGGLAALECAQDQTPELLAASGQPDVALTLAPLLRAPWPTATPLVVTASPCGAPSTTDASTATPTATATPAPTLAPRAVVRPGPAAGLRVRGGPGLDYRVLGTLTGGAQLAVIGRNARGDWVEVCCLQVAGVAQPGWVRADLVQLDSDVTDLPVLASPESK
jgi:hypothetical protein